MNQTSRPASAHKARRGQKKRSFRLILLLLLLSGVAVSLAFLIHYLKSARIYSAENFGLQVLVSSVDANKNGMDDYADITAGARAYVATEPVYDGSYHAGGYPPEGIGVCTDVVWQAFKAAGYDLKAMIDADIAANTALYPRVAGKPDPNIDFRRVPNLKVFFERYGQSLTTDTGKIGEWQPGDIVIYEENYTHVAIVSDKRNGYGVPWIIHHGGEGYEYEENRLKLKHISGHYRFDAAKVPDEVLVLWP